MNIKGNDITVICTGGDDQLGGKDWDEALIEYVTERYEEEYGEDLSEDPEMIAGLYNDVEVWKKSLSSREKINMTVNGPAGRFREELTREKYDELTENLLDRTKNLLDDVLSTAEKQGYDFSKIDKVLLVGGSSKMPQVSKMIERDYNVTPILTDPDEAVAKGAAIYASNQKDYNDFILEEANKKGKTVDEIKEENLVTGEIDKKYAMMTKGTDTDTTNINITNVLSRTYGIEVWSGDEYKIVNKLMINQELPATCIEDFYTRYDDQERVVIEIYESRSTDKRIDPEDGTLITEAELVFTKKVPKGTKITHTLALDNSGLLHIVAEDELTHSKLDTTFKLSNQMDDEEMEKAMTRMQLANVE